MKVYIAYGESFPDALAAGPAMASSDRLLLTAFKSVPSATVNAIKRLKPAEIVILGGTGAVSTEVETALKQYAPVRRIGGANRYDTAALIATDHLQAEPEPTPAPTPTPTPPPNDGSVSGEAMPTTDLPGWKIAFTDNFNTNIPLGKFPSSVSNRYFAYPYPWRDTSKRGYYNPERTTYVENGRLIQWLHNENGQNLVSAFTPKFANGIQNQLYGRYAIRWRIQNPIPRYKIAWLTWPQSEVWPRDGEIDYPEAHNLVVGNKIHVYMHRQDGTSGGDQDFYNSNVDAVASGWHTSIMEWRPNSCKFILDGKTFGHSTSRVPNTPMRWVIQSETAIGGDAPAPSTQGNIEIDWVAVWSYVP
jgi:hypothetical protein